MGVVRGFTQQARVVFTLAVAWQKRDGCRPWRSGKVGVKAAQRDRRVGSASGQVFCVQKLEVRELALGSRTLAYAVRIVCSRVHG